MDNTRMSKSLLVLWETAKRDVHDDGIEELKRMAAMDIFREAAKRVENCDNPYGLVDFIMDQHRWDPDKYPEADLGELCGCAFQTEQDIARKVSGIWSAEELELYYRDLVTGAKEWITESELNAYLHRFDARYMEALDLVGSMFADAMDDVYLITDVRVNDLGEVVCESRDINVGGPYFLGTYEFDGERVKAYLNDPFRADALNHSGIPERWQAWSAANSDWALPGYEYSLYQELQDNVGARYIDPESGSLHEILGFSEEDYDGAYAVDVININPDSPDFMKNSVREPHEVLKGLYTESGEYLQQNQKFRQYCTSHATAMTEQKAVDGIRNIIGHSKGLSAGEVLEQIRGELDRAAKERRNDIADRLEKTVKTHRRAM